jgi:protoheme IX farnesyltransferase
MEIAARQRARQACFSGYWSLIKFPQTALLLITAISAYTLTAGLPIAPFETAGMAIALFLSIGGCTALNMVLDRDIDAKMGRTAKRPLVDGRITPRNATIFGGALSAVGLAIAFALDWQFGAVVAGGFFFDLLVYTAWLKRRTPLSIVFGGVAGGMPILAGRVLALGRIDLIGLLLGGSILLWIPSHILTLATRYAEDYRQAGVPAWPNVFGLRATRSFIAVANLLNVLVLVTGALLLGIHSTVLAILLAMSLGMFALSTIQLIKPTEQGNWLLFKMASLYMLASSLAITIGVLL